MFRIRVTSVDKLMPKYLYYAIENLAQTHGQLSLDNLKNTKLKDERSGDERLLNDYCEIVEMDDDKEQVTLMRGDVTLSYHENTTTPPIPEVKYFE